MKSLRIRKRVAPADPLTLDVYPTSYPDIHRYCRGFVDSSTKCSV